MSRLSLTLCARPSGSRPSSSERSAGVCLPQTQIAALAVEHLAGLQIRFAVATTSERKPVGAPVGSLRSAADATETPSSSPIMWIGR